MRTTFYEDKMAFKEFFLKGKSSRRLTALLPARQQQSPKAQCVEHPQVH